MKRIDYYRAVLLGIVIGASLLSLFHFVFFTQNVEEPSKPQSNFEVVDKYKKCEVIRWSDRQVAVATYKYFLNCEK